MMFFETARLVVRKLEDSDFDHLFRLLSDPEVMRYVREPYTKPEQMEERMRVWTEYGQKRPGLGTFILQFRETGDFAGFCVARQLAYDTSSEEYEVGYILAPEYWGKGLASELVPPLSRHCFRLSAAKHLVAFTHTENMASQRVLLKSGFRYMGPRQTADGISAEFWLVANEV